MKKVIVLMLALLLFAPLAYAEEPAQDTAFEEKVLDILKKNPQVIKEVLEKYEKDVAEKQKEEEFKKLLSEKVQVDIGESHVKGDKDAKITIIGFSDFQCPFCKRGDDTIKELINKHGEKKIKYVFKNFPLGFHPEATPSAKASWAAGKQKKFYEYHDKLFENQGKLGEELYVQIAKDLELDLEKFNKDRASEDAEKAVQAEMKQGQDVGIQGTPGFLVNGVKVLGAYPVEHFEKVITGLELEDKTAKN